MIFRLFRRPPNEALMSRLHGELMAQARQPALFIDYGVADTPEGRFEMVALHMLLAVRRLNALPSPGPDLARDLTDAMFRHFDIAFREMGVGDVAVPKRMKKYAANWLGRAKVYGSALDADDSEALAASLARNVYGETSADHAPQSRRLARYVRAVQHALEPADIEIFLAGPLPGVDAAQAS